MIAFASDEPEFINAMYLYALVLGEAIARNLSTVVLVLGSLLLQFYVWTAVRRIFLRRISERGRRVLAKVVPLALAYINLPLLVIAQSGAVRVDVGEGYRFALLYPFWIWQAAMLGMAVILGGLEAVRWQRRKRHWREEPPRPERQAEAPRMLLSRRDFLHKAALTTGGLFTAMPLFVATHGAFVAAGEPEVSRIALKLDRLPRALDGLRIAQISDLHVSMFTRATHIHKVAEQVNRFKPDMVTVTGDFISWSGVFIDGCAEALQTLVAPEGVWGCLGNWDYYVSAPAVLRIMESKGIGMLRNQHALLTVRNERLVLAGVDDFGEGRPDIRQTLDGVPADACVILLCHQPGYFPVVRDFPVDLALVGHTHGGQIALKLSGIKLSPATFRYRYVEGLFHENGTYMYVNRGIGTTGPPIRINVLPEITIFDLYSNQGQ